MMSKRESLVYSLLSVVVTLLFADRYLYLGAIVLFIAFMVTIKKLRIKASLMLYVFAAIGGLILVDSMFAINPAFSQYYNTNVAVKEIIRIAMYAITLEIVSFVKIDIKTYTRVWKALLIFIVVIALIQFTKVFDINSILIRIYGYSVQFINSSFSDLSRFRCGSIFVNPNVFACFLVAMLGSYMFMMNYAKETKLARIVTFGLLFVGIVLSGSRTGLVLSIVILAIYLFLSKINSMKKTNGLKLIALMTLLCILIIWMLQRVSNYENSTLRMLELGAGTINSLGIKLGVFIRLLKQMGILNALVGFGPYNNTDFSGALMVDFDIGYFLTFYGICGMIIYIAYIIAIRKWGRTRLPGRDYLNKVLFWITILFGITAGVYFNLRIFSIYMLMFMPRIYVNKDQVA